MKLKNFKSVILIFAWLPILIGLGSCKGGKFGGSIGDGETPSFGLSAATQARIDEGDLPAEEPLVFSNFPLHKVIETVKDLLGSKLSVFEKGSDGKPAIELELDPVVGQLIISGNVKLPLESLIGMALLGAPLDDEVERHSFKLAIRPAIRYARDCKRTYKIPGKEKKICGVFSILDFEILSLQLDHKELRQSLAVAGQLISMIVASSKVASYVKSPDGSDIELSNDLTLRAAEFLESGSIRITEAVAEFKSRDADGSRVKVKEIFPVISIDLNIPELIPGIRSWGGNDDELKYLIENLTFWAFSVTKKRHGGITFDDISVALGVGEPSEAWLEDNVKKNERIVKQIRKGQLKKQYRLYIPINYKQHLKRYMAARVKKKGLDRLLKKYPNVQEEIDRTIEELYVESLNILNAKNPISDYSNNPKKVYEELKKKAKFRILKFVDVTKNRLYQMQAPWAKGSAEKKRGWPLLMMQISEKAFLQMSRAVKDLKTGGVNIIKELNIRFSPNPDVPSITISGLVRLNMADYLYDYLGPKEKEVIRDQVVKFNEDRFGDSIPFSLEIGLYKVVDSDEAADHKYRTKIEFRNFKLFSGKYETNFSASGQLGSAMFKIAFMIAATAISSKSFSIDRTPDPVEVTEAIERRHVELKRGLGELGSIYRRVGTPRDEGAMLAALEKVMGEDISNSPHLVPYELPISSRPPSADDPIANAIQNITVDLKNVVRADSNGIKVLLDANELTNGVFSEIGDLNLWHFQLASTQNPNRPVEMRNITFLEIAVGQGTGSELHNMFVRFRNKAVSKAISNGSFRKHVVNPVDIRFVLSLDDINHKMNSVIKGPEGKGIGVFEFSGKKFYLDGIELSAVKSGGDLPDSLKANIFLATNDSDEVTRFEIEGILGLKSINKEDAIDALDLGKGEVIYGNQILSVEFMENPKITIDPPILSFGRFLNNITGSVFNRRWMEEGPNRLKIPAKTIISLVINPIFNHMNKKDEGNLELGGMKLNSILKIKGHKGEILLMINPRLISQAFSISMLPAKLAKP